MSSIVWEMLGISSQVRRPGDDKKVNGDPRASGAEGWIF